MVVAVEAEWQAEDLLPGGVQPVAAQVDPVWTQLRLSTRSARDGLAGLGGASGVDGTEAGCGEGGEDGAVVGDGGGDALAAGEPGSDDLVGVAAVGGGAGRADRGATVAAVLVDDAVRHRLGADHAERHAR